MQVGFRDLSIWSFLMASAHGAGFMVLPFVMKFSEPAAASHGDAHGGAVCHAHAAPLRTAWFNLDWFWAGALVIAGLFVLLI